MPPRSYYNEPRLSDYAAFAMAYFPEDAEAAIKFSDECKLPYIETVDHLSSYIGIASSLVRQVMHRPAYHYRNFSLEKKDGSTRQIFTPRTYLKTIQWWICDNILDQATLGDCVHGFRRHRSYITNAQKHVGRRHILNVDIKSFFDTISHADVRAVYSSLGYGESGGHILTSLTSLDGRAPTGAPTSPMVANIVLKSADLELTQFAAETGLLYTRYADDLTFSSNDWIASEAIQVVAEIIGKYGFSLNPNKSRFMGPGDRQEVTGLLVNKAVNTTKAWRNSARGFLHKVNTNPEKFVEFSHKVCGIYGTLIHIDPEATKKITQTAVEAMRNLQRIRFPEVG